MKLLIGLTGEKGSGKGTFAELLCKIAPPKISIHPTRFSDLLAETLNAWHIPTTRANLQKLSIMMDREFGIGVLAAAIRHRVENDPSDVVILDGVRWQADVRMIRGFQNNVLVYITADPEVRFERLQGQGKYIGEVGMNFEQFQREERAATELLIPEIGRWANFKVCNNGSLREFRRVARSFYEQYVVSAT